MRKLLALAVVLSIVIVALAAAGAGCKGGDQAEPQDAKSPPPIPEGGTPKGIQDSKGAMGSGPGMTPGGPGGKGMTPGGPGGSSKGAGG